MTICYWRKILSVLCFVQIVSVSCGPMRNYTNGYHPAGGADPRYLNYGEGVVIPNLVNPRIPGPEISLTPRHHLEKYIGVRPGPLEYDYITEYGEEYYENYDDISEDVVVPEITIPIEYHEESTSIQEDVEIEKEPSSKATTVTYNIHEYYSTGEVETHENGINNSTTVSGKIHCRDGGRGYRSGELFKLSADPCTTCRCSRFGPQCNRTECQPLPSGCFELIQRPDECCPICLREGCTFRNRTFSSGESIQLTACETCQCGDDGRMYCSVADCTPPPCVDASIVEGQCCYVCPNGPNCYTTILDIIPMRQEWVPDHSRRCIICRCWHKPGSDQLWMGNRMAECKRDPRCDK
uniref:uncharacterized protein LOC120337794 n=1 Tax=Styela clava TaxID=7725 RepID=UPI00193AD05B|nr:uncharacterized protein LOC120337794 [Styela clava]